ncbi:MAG: thioredoxin domain-containing protein [Gemmataceae bacterium]|nr:thioredoxin domain-containing protein [Gemmata sp.]MDW8197270.1 thioredoxin domain-containing protein [Gemmataceae bacterium]
MRVCFGLFVLVASGAVMVAVAAGADAPPPPGAKHKGPANRLARSSSPYLLQHASNPVDWYPWGPEAFERAQKEKKLIFLSIGYSSCHWCHVMERESFSNPEIAKILNDNFVCIKVDREERPDIDDIYMTALQVTDQPGGWPLNMFLTPTGKPIFGGTYFPADDKTIDGQTIRGFKSVLKKVLEFDQDRADLEKQADYIAQLTIEALEANSRLVALVQLDRALITDALEAFDIDPEYGGTGSKARGYRGPKFPRPPVWGFLLAYAQKTPSAEWKKKVTLTLGKMLEGGIYDQLGGGFHRYSTERTWTVPHFEKMLYDNAQLVELYSEAYAVDPRPEYRRVVAETLAFIRRDMTSPQGAFYSALDADSNGKEGAFYVWTTEELKAVLGNDADFQLVKSVYGIGAPNFEEKFHILRLPKPLADIARERKSTEEQLLAQLEPLQKKLLDHRRQRQRPFLDTKIITAWNGLMIAAYAKAGQVFQEKAYTTAAAQAADFLLTTMRDPHGRLYRIYAAVPGQAPTATIPGFLDDYAYFIHGLLHLHDATGDAKWLDAAQTLTDVAIRWFADGDKGGFYFSPSDGEKLFVRPKDSYDGVQPSGNAQMARNLLRLGAKRKNEAYRDRGIRTIKAFALALRTSPAAMPTMLRALHELLETAETQQPPRPKDPPQPKKPKTSADVVDAHLTVETPPNGPRRFTLNLTIHEPWYLYANPVGLPMLAESQTEVRVYVAGQKVDSLVNYPKGQNVKESTGEQYAIYTGTVSITGTIPEKAGDIEVRVHVNACKPGVCLPPGELRLRPTR